MAQPLEMEGWNNVRRKNCIPADDKALSRRQRLHAHHCTRCHGIGKTLDCSHGWRAPATFDACHHALGCSHACGFFALRQARLRACCNQLTGQLKLGRLCVIGLANGGVSQQSATDTSTSSNTPSTAQTWKCTCPFRLDPNR
jgi:hypothetical protein